jgi:ADP-dependent NAD(P)H-hydrate dehydratase / NAD(P)H-hydrate epimerase
MVLPIEQYLAVYDSRKISNIEQHAVRAGCELIDLMEKAGAAVAEIIQSEFTPVATIILAGPGNNGGDAYVVARHLLAMNWPVKIATDPGYQANYSSFASTMVQKWQGSTIVFDDIEHECPQLIIDGLFGTGLKRAISGKLATLVNTVNDFKCPIVAIDIPSGLNSDDGVIKGVAIKAGHTVTFNFKKPGHLLLPGKEYCGKISIQDISLKPVETPNALINSPELWKNKLPTPKLSDHKYKRGVLALIGGAEMTGAIRLAALAARRVGLGMAIVICSEEAKLIYSLAAPGVIVQSYSTMAEYCALINNAKISAFVVGSGLLANNHTAELTLNVLKTRKPAILDAGALTAFEDNKKLLFSHLHEKILMTPHEGEFRRVFASADDKLKAAQNAAEQSGVTVLYKGADTVIAANDCIPIIQENAPPYLATAGAGDILAGLCGGFAAQGIALHDAAAMATWFAAEAAYKLGIGLIAEDLPYTIHNLLKKFVSKF